MNLKQQLKIKDMAAFNANGISRKRTGINLQKQMEEDVRQTNIDKAASNCSETLYNVLTDVISQYGGDIISLCETVDLLVENDFWNEFVGFQDDEEGRGITAHYGTQDDRQCLIYAVDSPDSNFILELYPPSADETRPDYWQVKLYDKKSTIESGFIDGSDADDFFDFFRTMFEQQSVNGDDLLGEIELVQQTMEDYINDFKEWVNTEFPEVDE